MARITPIEFMIFVGLLALYLFFTEWSRTAVSTGSYRWLDIQGTGAQLPSVDKTIEILNGVLSERKKSANWDTPIIVNLLPGIPSPHFTVEQETVASYQVCISLENSGDDLIINF